MNKDDEQTLNEAIFILRAEKYVCDVFGEFVTVE